MLKTIEFLKQCDQAYYNGEELLISDDDYDILKEELKEQYPNDPYFNEVGSTISKNKVKLPYVLGSLNKFKIDTIEKQLYENRQHTFVITPKYDGMSDYVEYENGKLQKVYSRGDGVYGEDITRYGQLFLPKTTKYDGLLQARGELLLTNKYAIERGYKTGRNLVASLMNKKTISQEHKDIQFIFYQLLYPVFDTEEERLSFLKQYLPTVDFMVVKEPSTIQLINIFKKYKEEIEYDVDGIVITHNETPIENIKYPSNKYAFKINTDGVLTNVVDIEWQVSRTGRVVPVLVVEPTIIGGVEITRVTANNYKYLKEKNIGIGSSIKIVRSGDVIPLIVEVLSEGTKSIPMFCPSCAEKLVEVGVDLKCLNSDCYDNIYKKIEHFFVTLGAENVAEKTFQNLGVKSVKQAYELDEFTIGMKEGFGLTSGETIVREIQNTLKTTPDKLLAAFGIPFVGVENARKIMNVYTFEELFSNDYIDISSIPGLGEKIEKIFNEHIKNYSQVYDYLLSIGLEFKKENDMKFKGLIFTLTGDGPKDRNSITKDIEEVGGLVKNLTKKSNYLVCNDITTMTTKAKKARQYGIEMITYDDLYEMIGE